MEIRKQRKINEDHVRGGKKREEVMVVVISILPKMRFE